MGPSSITYKSLLDIILWIYDEIIGKNQSIVKRLAIIIVLWLIITPFIIHQMNEIFFQYFNFYNVIRLKFIFSSFGCLKHAILCCKSFKLKTMSFICIQSILSYFCPYQQTIHLSFTQNSFYYFAAATVKGMIFIILVLLACAIGLSMKNTAKPIKEPNAFNNNVQNEEESKEETEQRQFRRKETIYSEEEY